MEASVGTDDVAVAGVLYQLARCLREGKEVGTQAEEYFQRAVEIQEAKLGPDDVQV